MQLLDKDAIKMAEGGFIDHLLKNCPNLSHLALSQSGIYRIISSGKYTSVSDLDLVGVDLNRSVLCELSERLPCLNTLKFSNAESVIMPFQSFKTLSIQDSFFAFGPILLKVSTIKQTRFFKFDLSGECQYNWNQMEAKNNKLLVIEQDYLDGLNDDECSNLSINFQSIHQLKVSEKSCLLSNDI
jgi:hypothetical protein